MICDYNKMQPPCQKDRSTELERTGVHGSNKARMHGRRDDWIYKRRGEWMIVYIKENRKTGWRGSDGRREEERRKGRRNEKRWGWWMGVFFYRVAFNKTLQYDVILREQLHFYRTTLCTWTTTQQ